MLKAMRGLLSLLVLSAALTTTTAAKATVLTEIEVYSRCYIRLVRLIPSASDPLYSQVQAGTLSGADACMQLFDSASMDATGVMTNRSSTQARRIVKTLNDYHRTWIQQRVPVSTGGDMLLLYDMEEPALYFTRAAFQSKVPFSSVVTMTNGLSGVRDREVGAGSGTTFQAQRIFAYRGGTTYFGSADLVMYYEGQDNSVSPATDAGPQLITLPGNDIVQVGELVGTRSAINLTLPAMRNMTPNFNTAQHFGSGVIGSQTFISDYNPFPAGTLANSYTNIYRRVTAHVFEDILCHQLPTLLPGDVASEVNPSSTYTFQQNSSCLQCHSQVDNAALSFRNVAPWFSPFIATEQAAGMSGFYQMPNLGPTAFRYYNQPPTGRLHYRELMGGAVQDFPLTGIQDIGPILAAGNDLYTCAAKRYYQFFTGVNVDLTQPATTDAALYHQNLVIKYAQDLKQSQSVRGLINEIVHSDPFKSTNYNAAGAP